jgi:hypothetical protein
MKAHDALADWYLAGSLSAITARHTSSLAIIVAGLVIAFALALVIVKVTDKHG